MGFPGGSEQNDYPLQDSCLTFAWRTPWAEESGVLQSMRLQSDTTKQLALSLHFPCYGRRVGEDGLDAFCRFTVTVYSDGFL